MAGLQQDEHAFWQQQLKLRSAGALAALVSEALRTRTYLAGRAFSASDEAVLAALRTAPALPRLERWRSACAAHAPPSPLEARLARLELLARTVQDNFGSAAPSPSVLRVARALQGLPGSALLRVPADYYALPLRERARLLGAPVGALCKTLVFENKGVEAGAAGGGGTDVRAPLAQQRFLAVIVQYAAKLNLAALGKALGGGARLELAAEGRALTGYEHNAVTHLGALTPLPVVLAREAAECGSAFIFLGGGQEDVKARVFLKPLAAQPGVFVLPISEARPEEEWES